MRSYAASDAAADSARPLVALVGRPNVGKSSLYNRLVGGRPALVEDMPGVTRDRRYGVVEWPGSRFRVVDTGGLDPSAHGILGAMRAQTMRAIDEADVLALIVDVVEGVTTVDTDVVGLLRRSGKPVVMVANKVDTSKREAALAEVYALGFSDVFAISASHGRGIGELLDRLVELLGPGAAYAEPEPDELESALAEAEAEQEAKQEAKREARHKAESAIERAKIEAAPRGEATGEDPAGEGGAPAPGPIEDTRPDPYANKPIRIAFVGKPNVGKSSLVNRLLGEERVLVHDMPGTTRDPIDTPFTVGGREFVLVDTAGLRRRRSVDTQTEAVAGKMARDQLARCDVAMLVIDAGGGATVEDAKIAGLIEDAGRPTLVVLNKRDVVPRAKVDARVDATRETLPFLSWAPVLLTSALTGAGVATLPEAAARVFAAASKRISTGELNRFLEALTTDKPPPAGPNGRHVRLFFATQAQVRPPTFVFSTNHPKDVPVSYRRFLSNQLRASYGFEGTPLRIVMRERKKKKLIVASTRMREKRHK